MTEDTRTKLRQLLAVKRGLFDTDELSLMVATGVALWASTTFTIIVASFIPEVAPDNVAFWRVALGIPAAYITIGAALIGLRLPDRYVYWGVLAAFIPGILVNLVLLFLTPATVAILANLTVPMIYGAFHLKTREVLWSLCLATLIALSAPYVAPDGATPNINSWLAVYIPLLWMMTFAMHLGRRQVRAAQLAAEAQARTDTLTGLADQRGLREFANQVLTAEAAGDEVIGLLMIDLDNFKMANSLHGHLGGDHALRTVANHLRQVAPKRSILARVGGDEFALLLAAGSQRRVDEVADIMRGAVRAANIDIDLAGVELDASVGAAIFRVDGDTLDELFDAADQRMYSVKDRHHAAAPPVVPPRAAPDSDNPVEWATQSPTIRTSPHGAVQVALHSRTPYARLAATMWASGGVVMALALLMPDAINPHPLIAWLLIAVSVLLAGVTLILNPEPRGVLHVVGDASAALGIVLLIWATGGFDSPALMMIILLVISQGWFWETRHVIVRLATNLLVVATPLLYTSFTNFPWAAATSAYASGVIVVTLTFVLFLNGRVLAALSRRAERSAATDALTGIANRRAFDDYVERQLQGNAEGEVEPFAIVMIDLDNFKEINTNEGHQAGDTALREIAETLSSVTRGEDLLARVGGDEFAAVLSGVGIESATSLAERFIGAVEGTAVARRCGVGASAGFALCPLHGNTLDELMLAADNALMSVKQSGKGAARVGRVSPAD